MRLGRGDRGGSDKGGRGGRHRGGQDHEPPDHDRPGEYDSYLSALGAGRKDSESFGTAQVFQVRLPPDVARQLQLLAARRETAPLSLIQDFVIDGLRRAR